MTSLQVVPRSGVDLQRAINEEHAKVLEHASGMVQHAAACGQMLIEMKETLQHGTWEKWLANNFDSTAWTAQAYMRVANAYSENPEGIANLHSIRAVLRSITPPKLAVEPPRPLDPDSDTGRMFAFIVDNSVEVEEVDGEVVLETAPVGVEDRKWRSAVGRLEEIKRCMNEAISPRLTNQAAAQALQDASIAARRTAVELEQMATARRRV